MLWKVRIAESTIHGYGAFAARDFKPGGVIEDNIPMSAYEVVSEVTARLCGFYSALRIGPDRYLINTLGRGASWMDFINHSDTPNATFNETGQDLLITCDVLQYDELTIDYRVWGFSGPLGF